MKNARFYFLIIFLPVLLGTFCFAQSTANSFFQKLYAASPDAYFPLSDDNSGSYEETIKGGQFITRQSFLIFDAYANGKARYAKALAAENLHKFLPATTFFAGELSCNLEFNQGKLPFIGFVNESTVGYFVHPGYDLLAKAALSLFGQPLIKGKRNSEAYADALTELFAGLRLRPGSCNEKIELQKGQFSWAGNTLSVQKQYLNECEVNAKSGKWAQREFQIALDFEFLEGHLKSIDVISWP